MFRCFGRVHFDLYTLLFAFENIYFEKSFKIKVILIYLEEILQPKIASLILKAEKISTSEITGGVKRANICHKNIT